VFPYSETFRSAFHLLKQSIFEEGYDMRLISWIGISALAILMGSVMVLARDYGPDRVTPWGGRDADKHYRENARDHERDMRESDREREREWREYLRERRNEYRDWSRASRRERDDFDRYRRDRWNQEGDSYGNRDRFRAPRDGVCFYTDSYYRGESYCIGSQESQSYVGKHYNDRISSIRFFGRVPRIVVYEHENFEGARRMYAGDVPSLGNFNDKISSVEIR
jgi:hypothetical protein